MDNDTSCRLIDSYSVELDSRFLIILFLFSHSLLYAQYVEIPLQSPLNQKALEIIKCENKNECLCVSTGDNVYCV